MLTLRGLARRLIGSRSLNNEFFWRRAVNRFVLFLFAMWFVANCSVGQPAGQNVSKVGTTAAAFLEVPVGARANGMGNAFVGTSDDVTSLYWNPSGIAALRRLASGRCRKPARRLPGSAGAICRSRAQAAEKLRHNQGQVLSRAQTCAGSSHAARRTL